MAGTHVYFEGAGSTIGMVPGSGGVSSAGGPLGFLIAAFGWVWRASGWIVKPAASKKVVLKAARSVLNKRAQVQVATAVTAATVAAGAYGTKRFFDALEGLLGDVYDGLMGLGLVLVGLLVAAIVWPKHVAEIAQVGKHAPTVQLIALALGGWVLVASWR